jgi:hypothetical protein
VRSHAEIKNKRHVAGTTYGVEMAPVTAQAGIPAAITEPATPMAWNVSASARPTFVPILFHTDDFNASSAVFADTVGRPKQLMIALQTLLVVIFLLIDEPPTAKVEPVVDRINFLYRLANSANAASTLRSILETCARMYLPRKKSECQHVLNVPRRELPMDRAYRSLILSVSKHRDVVLLSSLIDSSSSGIY